MIGSDSHSQLLVPLRTVRIITAALMTGPILFLLFVLAQRGVDGKDEDATPIVTYAAAGAAVLAIAGRILLPALVVRAGRQQIARQKVEPPSRDRTREQRPLSSRSDPGDLPALLNLYQTKTIVGAALLEGAALFAILSYMLEAQIVGLVVAGVMIGGILLGFPTRSGLEAWLEGQHQLLEEDRRHTL